MVAQRQPEAVSVEAEPLIYDSPLPIRLPPDWELTDERFLEIAHLNPDQMIERTPDGRLHLMTWPDGLSEHVGARLIMFVGFWHLAAGGEIRTGTGGYFLPDDSASAPDLSWVAPEQIAERGGVRGQFYLAPRFIIEVRSPSQTIPAQQSKMRRWINNGVQLAWLIDPYDQQVWIYRPDGTVEQLDRPAELSGEDVCPGLTIDMNQIWQAD